MITKIEKFDMLNGNKKTLGKNYLYSQIIRNERIKRRLTLEEMSKGICSVSYLCKFEKNAIIADEDYIRAIFERVDMDYKKVGSNIIEDGVNNVVKAYLYQNHNEIEKYYNLIDDTLFNAQNYLIKGFYYLVKQDYIKFKDIIATIDNIKDTLMIEDVGVFMFLVIEYYIQTNQFLEASKYLKFLEPHKFDLQEINWLIYEQQFCVGFNLKKYPVLYRFYYKLMNNINIGYPIKRQLLIRMMMLDVEAKDFYPDVYNEIKSLNLEVLNDYNLDILYWKLMIMLKGGNWFEVFDIIVESRLASEGRFLCLLLYAADIINDANYIKKAVALSKEFSYDEKDTIHQKFIRFMVIKLTDEKKYSLIEYLKYEILPYNENYIHHLYSEIYDKHYLDFLCSTSKYKEAFYYSRKTI